MRNIPGDEQASLTGSTEDQPVNLRKEVDESLSAPESADNYSSTTGVAVKTGAAAVETLVAGPGSPAAEQPLDLPVDSLGVSQQYAATAVPAQQRSRLPLLLAGLALLIALVTAIAAYWWWRESAAVDSAQTQALIEQLAQSNSRMDALQSALSGIQTGSQQLRDELGTALNSRLDAQKESQQALQTAQRDLRDSVQALSTELRKKTGTSAALAEAEYLLRTAANHLLFDRDVATAIAALGGADQLLRTTGDPTVIRIRGLLAEDINALSALKPVDFSGMALNLSSLINNVDQLPLPPASKNQLPDAHGVSFSLADWRALPTELWTAIKSLVVIHHDEQTVQALMPPDQTYFLYQNLRLELAAARLALLRHDTDNFRASLSTATEWINAAFDTKAAPTRHLLTSLAQFSTVELEPPLPDLAPSLNALRSLVENSSIAAEQAVTPVAEAEPNTPIASGAAQP